MRDPQLSRAVTRQLPGLIFVAVGTALGYLLYRLVPAINPGSACVLLGCVAVNVGLVRERFAPGIGVVAKRVLRIAVVLLGLQLSLRQVAELGGSGLAVVIVTVAITFAVTLFLGRLLRIPGPTALLVATGFSICGASAIAAMEPVARGRREDVAVGIALVTLCGSLAIVVLPLLQHPLGLVDPDAFGSWVGASVHDVGQTVATANRVAGALDAAVIVKLTRVILLAPLVLGVGLVLRARRRRTRAEDGPEVDVPRPPAIPLFVAGFLIMIVINSVLRIPSAITAPLADAQGILLSAALFALGTGVSLRVMRAAGGRPLLLGLASWIVVAAVAYAGVALTHHV